MDIVIDNQEEYDIDRKTNLDILEVVKDRRELMNAIEKEELNFYNIFSGTLVR